MAVSTSYSPITVSWSSSNQAIPVTFPFLTGTLVVTEVASTGVETVKSLTTHYTVSGGTDSNGLPATGTVTMVGANTSGSSIRITRVTPKTQATAFTNGGAFPAKSVEALADKLTLIAQEGGNAGTVNDGIAGDVMELVSSGATDYWDAESQIIRNVADAVNDTDAVNYGQLQDVLVDAGSGDVVGPASATDNTVALFDGATGNLLKASVVSISAGGNITGTGDIRPAANDGGVLGSGTLSWSDLFLASGGVINWNAGDVTVTHSANALAFAGASSGYSFDAAPLPSANDGAALGAAATSWSDLFLASGAVVNFNNGDVTVTHSANNIDVAGGTLSVASAAVKTVGKETIWVPAGAMTARTTNGAASGTTELATNDIMLRTLDFDTTTEEGAGFMIAMPKSWNESTVTFKAFWTAASGSGGVAWGLAAYSLSDDDAMDTAVSGQQIVTDTLLTTNDMHITSESSAITIGGSPAEGDVVYFEVTREVANGSDTIAADAKLIGVHVYITTNASTDA